METLIVNVGDFLHYNNVGMYELFALDNSSGSS